MRRTATPREGRQVSVKRAWSSLASLASSYKIYLAFVALVVSFTVASPVFVSPGNVLNIGRQTALVSIIAVGMTFVIITAEIDLSVASTLALSGMLGAIAMQNFANIWVVGVVVALATGTSIGLVNGVLTTALSIPSFLSSLGMLGVARGIAMMVTDTRPVPITNYEYVTIFGAGSVLSIPVPIVWTIVVIAGGTIGLHFLSFGRRVFATGGNANAARYSGIDTKRVKIKAFAITGFLAGLAGIILTARTEAARPDFAQGLELDVIAAVILGGTSLFGGRGTIMGTLLGSLMIGVLNNGLTIIGVSSSAQLVVKGVIIIAAVGLSGGGNPIWSRRRPAATRGGGVGAASRPKNDT